MLLVVYVQQSGVSAAWGVLFVSVPGVTRLGVRSCIEESEKQHFTGSPPGATQVLRTQRVCGSWREVGCVRRRVRSERSSERVNERTSEELLLSLRRHLGLARHDQLWPRQGMMKESQGHSSSKRPAPSYHWEGFGRKNTKPPWFDCRVFDKERRDVGWVIKDYGAPSVMDKVCTTYEVYTAQ